MEGQKKVYSILYLIFGWFFIKLKNNVSINRNITFCYLQPLETGKTKSYPMLTYGFGFFSFAKSQKNQIEN